STSLRRTRCRARRWRSRRSRRCRCSTTSGVDAALALRNGGCVRRLILLGFYGACVRVGLFALPLSGAGLTFFAAAKKVSKESSFFPPMLAMRLQTAPSEWSNRGSVLSGVSSLLACRRGAHVAPLNEVDQQSFIQPRATRSPV